MKNQKPYLKEILLSLYSGFRIQWHRNEGAIALSQGNLTSLTTLCLGDEGADGLSQNSLSTLTTLNLDSNSLRVKGAKLLS